MKEQYFNPVAFDYAKSILGTDPFESKLRFEEYLKKYPKDYSSRMYYTFVLIGLGQFKEAEKIIKATENDYIKNERFMKDKKKILLLKQNIIQATLKLLSYQERYEELHKYCLENSNIIKEMGLNRVIFYCNKKLGKLDSNRREGHSYSFRQIVEYDEKDFLEHIKSHILDAKYNEDKNSECFFSENFPITEVIEEVKKYIPSDKALYTGYIIDEYTFKYDGCGRVNNKTVNYIRVICFHNKKDIVTMYPVVEGEKLPHIDINYMNKEIINAPKQKGLSRIEKFNKKYGLQN